jgi:hypothetical protein
MKTDVPSRTRGPMFVQALHRRSVPMLATWTSPAGPTATASITRFVRTVANTVDPPTASPVPIWANSDQPSWLVHEAVEMPPNCRSVKMSIVPKARETGKMLVRSETALAPAGPIRRHPLQPVAGS